MSAAVPTRRSGSEAATVCSPLGLNQAYTRMIVKFDEIMTSYDNDKTAAARRLSEYDYDWLTHFHLRALVGATSTRYPDVATLLSVPEAYGCTHPSATNFQEAALVDDGSCDVPGCTNSSFGNFDPRATRDDGSCLAPMRSRLLPRGAWPTTQSKSRASCRSRPCVRWV